MKRKSVLKNGNSTIIYLSITGNVSWAHSATYARPDEGPESDKPGYFTVKYNEGIEEITQEQMQKTNKFLIDGVLYITTPDGVIYDAQGAKVK